MIKLEWKNLRYDIEQQTYRLAEMRLANSIADIKSGAEIDGSESLNDLALRWAEEGCALVGSILKDRLSGSMSSGSNYTDELHIDNTVWTYTLKDGSWKTDEKNTAVLIHAYVVAYVLHKWAITFAPNEVGTFASEMGNKRDMLEKEVFSIGTPKKKRVDMECDQFEPEIVFE